MLQWAWQDVSRSALKRTISLASTNPHEMLPAETAAGSVALLEPSCGNDTQLNACQSSWLYMWWSVFNINKVVSVKCCTGHGRVFQGEHWSTQWALHPQTRIRCWLQRQRLDQWHCCSQAVEMIDNHGTQHMSVQLIAAVYYKVKASNQARIHESELDVACRDSSWTSGTVAVKLWKRQTIMGLNACQSSWLQPFITKLKCYDCDMLHWAWQGVSSFALKRAMTLASTNPHEMLPAETAAGLVSIQLVAAVYYKS